MVAVSRVCWWLSDDGQVCLGLSAYGVIGARTEGVQQGGHTHPLLDGITYRKDGENVKMVKCIEEQ